MKLLVGLGNPDERFMHNRHNAGYMFIDWLVEKIGGDKNFKGEVLTLKTAGGENIFLKPRTYMNNVGKSVAAVVKFYKINASDIFVVHDDLDIPLGKYKIQQGKGPKVHNGIISVEKSLGFVDFFRVRIGIEARQQENRLSGEEYVLSNFTKREETFLKTEAFDLIKKEIMIFL